jgi:hypothetical protein
MDMDIWINEGLSCAAEWVYSGNHDNDYMEWYNEDNTKLISRGNNFYVWDNRYGTASTNTHPNAVLDDYATAYLFFQWLRLQSGGSTDIYKRIISSGNGDYLAVLNALPGYSSWGDLLKTWLAANYFNASGGPYGSMNDPVLKNVKAITVPLGTTSVQLYAGEGVYSVSNSAGILPNQSGNIRYAGLNKPNTTVSDADVLAGDWRLTYNVNTYTSRFPSSNPTESGSTTGFAANIVPAFYAAPLKTGPYRISRTEALRRNGREEEPLPPFIKEPGANDENL